MVSIYAFNVLRTKHVLTILAPSLRSFLAAVSYTRGALHVQDSASRKVSCDDCCHEPGNGVALSQSSNMYMRSDLKFALLRRCSGLFDNSASPKIAKKPSTWWCSSTWGWEEGEGWTLIRKGRGKASPGNIFVGTLGHWQHGFVRNMRQDVVALKLLLQSTGMHSACGYAGACTGIRRTHLQLLHVVGEPVRSGSKRRERHLTPG